MGLVTRPDAHTPRTDSQWVAGPGRMPQGRAVRRGTVPSPGRPTPREEPPPPPGALVPPRQHPKPAHKSGGIGGGDGSLQPHPPHPQPGGSMPRPDAPRARKASSRERALWGW